MARIRTVKPETFTSDDVNALPISARWTWVGIWTYADDEGRARADPRLIKAAVWPIDDEITAAEVGRHLDEIEKRGMICRYTSGGLVYLHIVNWGKHQRINRPTPTRFPACSKATHGGLTECSVSPPEPSIEDSLPEQGTGNREVEQGTTTSSSGADKPRTKRGTRIPDDFSVTPDMITWARENTPHVGAKETESFVDYWRAQPGQRGVKTDWEATWRNWMRRAQEGTARASPNGKPHQSYRNPADMSVYEEGL